MLGGVEMRPLVLFIWYNYHMDIATLKNMEESVKLAYAAGIFNGEGHVGFSMQKRKSGIDYPAVRISITQWHDPEILLAFKEIFGFGVVETHTKESYKYRYREQKPENIFLCIQRMWPWLSEPKRKDAQKTIDTYNEYLEKKLKSLKYCKHGHDMEINQLYNSKGARECRECKRISSRNYRKRNSDKRSGSSTCT